MYAIKGDTLVIPAEIDGKPVVEVDPHAFLYTDPSNIVYLMVEFSVQNLDFLLSKAFSSLEKAEIGEGIVKLNRRSFNKCKNFKSIRLPDSLETIGEWAFFECYSLAEIKFGSGLESIGDNAFPEDYNIKKLDLNEGLTSNDALKIQEYLLGKINTFDNWLN